MSSSTEMYRKCAAHGWKAVISRQFIQWMSISWSLKCQIHRGNSASLSAVRQADVSPWVSCFPLTSSRMCPYLNCTNLSGVGDGWGEVRQLINKNPQNHGSLDNQVTVILLTGKVVGVCKMYKLLWFLHLISVWVKWTSIKKSLTESALNPCDNVVIMKEGFILVMQYFLCSFDVFGTKLQ